MESRILSHILKTQIECDFYEFAVVLKDTDNFLHELFEENLKDNHKTF